MPGVKQPRERSSARLPTDVWGAIARATLRTEGDRAHAWERLRRVNSSWRAGLQGDYSVSHHTSLFDLAGQRSRTFTSTPARPNQGCGVHVMYIVSYAETGSSLSSKMCADGDIWCRSAAGGGASC